MYMSIEVASSVDLESYKIQIQIKKYIAFIRPVLSYVSYVLIYVLSYIHVHIIASVMLPPYTGIFRSDYAFFRDGTTPGIF